MRGIPKDRRRVDASHSGPGYSGGEGTNPNIPLRILNLAVESTPHHFNVPPTLPSVPMESMISGTTLCQEARIFKEINVF
jgi:hypothetical protein